MDVNRAKSFVNLLGNNAFSRFVYELFTSEIKDDQNYSVSELNNKVGDGVFEIEYHSGIEYRSINAHIVHNIPIELFKNKDTENIIDSNLKDKLYKYLKNAEDEYLNWDWVTDGEYGGHSIKFLSNNIGFSKDYYLDVFIPQIEYYLHELVDYFDPNILIGTPDSFFDLNPKGTIEVLDKFRSKYSDGLAFSFEDNVFEINEFCVNRPLPNGVQKENLAPVESIFFKKEKNDLLREFEHLIKKESREDELEKFLTTNYKSIFGEEYDRIETQVWLNFPDLDISNKARRMDIFLRNSIEHDWELLELKKIIPLTKSYRDIPVFTAEIYSSMEQLRNYKKILQSDKVKKYFASNGIEYYYPSLKLVVGKNPDIPIEKWRYLLDNQKNDVKIITYDDLLAQLKIRLNL